jgi:energy-coupling factor transport system substrate-specific component
MEKTLCFSAALTDLSRPFTIGSMASFDAWARSWSTRDLLVAITLSLGLGVVSSALASVTPLLEAFNPLLGSAVTGYATLIGLFVPYVMRRPGAGLLAAVGVGLVQAQFTPRGLNAISSGMILGLIYEAPFALAGYRRCGALFMIAAGAVTAVIPTALSAVASGLAALEGGAQLAVIGITVSSGAFGGYLAKSLADRLARSGVLASTALARHPSDLS